MYFIGLEAMGDFDPYIKYFIYMENVNKETVTSWIQEFKEKHEKKWNEIHAVWRRNNQDYIKEQIKEDPLMKDHFATPKVVTSDKDGIFGIPNEEYMKALDMLKDFLVKKGFKIIKYRTIYCSD